MPESILGISAYYHDSAAALLVNGEIVAAAQEERFTRKKFDASFPVNATKYVLMEAGVEAKDLTWLCTQRLKKFFIRNSRMGQGENVLKKTNY
jgi:predicted NodU family carbamoyl transferase